MTSPIPDPDLLARLAAEWQQRLLKGEHPEISEYTAKYPELADQLRELLPRLAAGELSQEQLHDTVVQTGLYVAPCGHAMMPVRLGDFRIVREIGRGGMGIVYEAEQESLGRRVALKVLPAGVLFDQRLRQRFRLEARAAARLHHTNIVPVFGVGEEGRLLYYVMQFIKGLGLDRVLAEMRRQQRQDTPTVKIRGLGSIPEDGEFSAAQMARSFVTGQFRTDPVAVVEKQGGPVPPPPTTLSCPGAPYWKAVARIGAQVAEALDYAAGQGVLHRDIKPSNLLLDSQGNVWVTDFGLAKVTAGEEGLTQTGDLVGTLRYLAPERFQGRADIRSDIYSLGLTIYELLVQRPAFPELDRSKLVHQVTHEEPLPPRKLVAAIPRDLETVVLKAIARDPAHRYPTALELAADLKRFGQDRPVRARRVRAAERMIRWCKRNPAFALLTTAVFVLLAAVATVASLGYVQTKLALDAEAEQRKETESQRLEADRHRAAAEAAEANAIAEADRALRQWYAASVNLMQLAWDNGEIERLQALLAETESYPDRGFEWYYWQRLCHLELITFIGHRARLTSVAWSADGMLLATGSADGTAKLWPVTGGHELFTFRGHASGVTRVVWSPDGQRLATASVDGSAKVWPASGGGELVTLQGHENCIFSIVWSPDGKRLATGCEDGTAKVWDAQDGRCLHTIKGHSSRVTSISWSPDGRLLATGSGHGDGTIKLWDGDNGRERMPLKYHPSGVESLSWSPDGTRLAIGNEDGTAKVWDVAGDREVLVLKAHRRGVVSLSWSADGRQLATGSPDGTAKVWDALGAREPLTLRAHSKGVAAVAWSPDGKRLATAGGNGAAKVWDVADSRQFLTLRGHTSEVLSVAWSPDDKLLATGSGHDDGSTKIWDAADGTERMTLKGHIGGVESVEWSPDGKLLATGSEDGTAKVWDPVKKRELHTLKGHSSIVHSVAWSPDGRRIVTGGDGGKAKVWDSLQGRELFALKVQRSAVASISWSRDSDRLATGNSDGTVKVWKADNGEELLSLNGHRKAVWSVSWSSDGQRLATGSFDLTAKVWNMADSRVLATLKGHTEAVESVSWSPDGRRLATGSDDGTVKIWETFGGRELLTLKGHTDSTRCVSWSRDGQRLASASEDGTAKVWTAASADAVREWKRQDRILEDHLALNHFHGSQALGFIQDWLVLLPVPLNKGESGPAALVRKQLQGEALMQPRGGERVRIGDQELIWQEYQSTEPVLDFNAVLGHVAEWSVAYAVCYLESERELNDVWLQVGSDDQAKVYLNGREVYRYRTGRALNGLDTVGPVTLKRGNNVLVFKVVNENSGWQGCARLVNDAGRSIEGIRVKRTP